MNHLSDKQIVARIRPHYRRLQKFAPAVRACGWNTTAEYKAAYMAVLRAGKASEFGLGAKVRRPAKQEAQS